jgi:hypothetical protein
VGRRLAFVLTLTALVLCVAPAVAGAQQPVLVTELNKPPAGYRLTAAQVQRIAARDARSRAELARHPRAIPYEYTKGGAQWQVSWFSRGPHQKELLQVYVDDLSGRVTEVWTGFQVAWTMARGYSGAFGRRVNSLYVWLPLCALFIAPFLPWRRPRRFTLWHLDLVVLLAFSISLAFFNHAKIGLSVPLVYPLLVYLLIRLLALAFGRGRPSQPLRLAVPISWLAVAVVFLVGFRIGLNAVDSNVIDVGYAGVIGADKLLHGKKLYGHWPPDNAYGDTYGPVNYYAYVPFRAIFGWSGTWDDLPASHGAAIAFDLLTLLGLFFLGRLIRGPNLGILLAYAWASYPFTLFTLESNSNDTLVALVVVLGLIAALWPAVSLRRGAGSGPLGAAGRGVVAALAGLTKFAPFALAPLFARGTGAWPRKRALLAFAVAFAATAAVAMLPVLLDHDLHAFWHDSVSYQASRPSPFSIWGLWGGLKVEQRLVQGLTVLLALLAAVVPGRRGPVEVAALAAAIMIGVELSLTHWFYLYIVWFLPVALVALTAAAPAHAAEPVVEKPAALVPAPA